MLPSVPAVFFIPSFSPVIISFVDFGAHVNGSAHTLPALHRLKSATPGCPKSAQRSPPFAKRRYSPKALIPSPKRPSSLESFLAVRQKTRWILLGFDSGASLVRATVTRLLMLPFELCSYVSVPAIGRDLNIRRAGRGGIISERRGACTRVRPGAASWRWRSPSTSHPGPCARPSRHWTFSFRWLLPAIPLALSPKERWIDNV